MLIYIAILSFTVLAVAVVLLFLYIRGELKDINESLSYKSYKNYKTSKDDSNKLSNLTRQLNDMKLAIEKQRTVFESRITKLEQIKNENADMQERSKPKKENTVSQEGSKRSVPEQDTRIWVQRTEDGLKKLEVSDTKKDMYLLKKGDYFLLNLTDLRPSSYVDIMNLYGSIIGFPAGFEAINKITMSVNPRYNKQGDYFHFEAQGEITVN
ncbi:MAG: hypothetical protein LHW41_03465 [Candidatus Cloacimonetes bacterium]|jgi:hypothetical protein|nr:hypothetical protein [Candidatus Cloacimonadota bacterium]MDD2489739.1 hypothetical protein [Bacilli bacterium]MDD3563139.1 hypothetical protein [Candidatus Cloacimonadota bacterium]